MMERIDRVLERVLVRPGPVDPEAQRERAICRALVYEDEVRVRWMARRIRRERRMACRS